MPYSGSAWFYEVVGQALLAYFAKVNDDGGINGRKVTVINLDDAVQPPKTVAQVRKMVAQEDVDAIVHQVGTARASPVRQYLNTKGVPQLFVMSGANTFQQPEAYRYNTSALMNGEFEAKMYGQMIVRETPDAEVGIPYQNDEDGKEDQRSMRSGFAKPLTAEITDEQSDPTVDSQMLGLKAAGADMVLLVADAKQVSQALRKMSWPG